MESNIPNNSAYEYNGNNESDRNENDDGDVTEEEAPPSPLPQ